MDNKDVRLAFTDNLGKEWDYSVKNLPFKVVKRNDYYVVSVLGADTFFEIISSIFFPTLSTKIRWNKIKDKIFKKIPLGSIIKLTAFSMGAAILEYGTRELINRGYILVDACLMNPFKSVKKYNGIVRNTKDFCSLWPFFRKGHDKTITIKSPYNFLRFKKNHFYIRDYIMNGGII